VRPEFISDQLRRVATTARLQGRPREDWSEFALSRLNLEFNDERPDKTPGKCDGDKFYFKKNCGYHLALISAEQANKEPTDTGWQTCKVCCTGQGKSSKLEKRFAIMAYWQLPHYQQVLQPRVLGRHGGVDFMFIQRHRRGIERTKLLVEVDGEQHFHGRYKNKTASEQWEIDRKKDQEAINRGLKLLRLHGKDEDEWSIELERAIEVAEKESVAAFVLYSLSYRRSLNEMVVKK
jgi:hypothetical protein